MTWRSFPVLLLVLVCAILPVSGQVPQPAEETQGGDEEWDDDEWEEDTGRSFFYKEVVVSGFYSRNGHQELGEPVEEMDHAGLSPHPPGTYVAVDYVRTFTASSPVNRTKMPKRLQLSAIDLHPRLVKDRQRSGDAFDFAPQDFWVRFQLAGRDRLTLRVGQFVLPYGVNPPLAPRQTFVLPVEELDLGLKWDWGIGVKGPLGRFDWELAATLGSGESWSSGRGHLLTGRVGSPTYWDFQYGLSFLVGELPELRGSEVLDEYALSRWRVALDTFYKHGTYLMTGAQLSYGQDGWDGDAEHVELSGGVAADVLGYRLWFDWVVPRHNDLRLGGQLESVSHDLGSPSADDRALVFEAGYSLTTEITLKLDLLMQLESATGEPDDAIYVTFVYYGS